MDYNIGQGSQKSNDKNKDNVMVHGLPPKIPSVLCLDLAPDRLRLYIAMSNGSSSWLHTHNT